MGSGGGWAVEDPEFDRLAGGAPHLSLEAIASHPRMPEARRLYLDRFLALYDNDPFMARLLIETGRFLVFHTAVVLAAGQDPARRETWFTVGRLKREVAVFGMVSGRQIDHLVARLCSAGFMTSMPAEADRRMRLLRPTEAMMAHDRRWLAAHYAPLTLVTPYDDYAPVMNQDPAYQLAHRREAIGFLHLSGKLLAVAPDLLLFFNHAAGHMVSATLLQAAVASGDQRAAVPFGDIGERFGISRTHVRAVLTEAEHAGLVRLHGPGGRQVEILPRLWASYDLGLAAGMFSHDIVHAIVVGRTSQARAPTAATDTGNVLRSQVPGPG